MGKLTDILNRQGKLASIEDAWESTPEACDEDVLPKGTYTANIIKGEAIESRSNQTPGYKLTFEVTEGDRAGSRFWHDCWFTTAALPRSKRDLGRLGVTSLKQLEQPLPAIYRCEVQLTIRRDDEGGESNQVRSFKVLEVIQPKPDPFAPEADESGSAAVAEDDRPTASVASEKSTDESIVASTNTEKRPAARRRKKAVKKNKKKAVGKPAAANKLPAGGSPNEL